MKKIITFLLLFLHFNFTNAQSTILLTPQLSPTPISIEDFFGLNGQNTNEPGLGFDNPSVINALDLTQTSTLRLPGGTVANYWDWKQGNYIDPISPTTNCFGLPDDFGATNPQNDNSLSSFKNAIRRANAKPIWTLNVLTDDLASQLSMLSEAKLLGLPIKYIELGNEFYLLNDCYEEKFPSPVAYGEFIAGWIPEIRNRFPDVRIACVGAASGGSAAPERRNTWNNKLRSYFSTLNVTKRPNAFTIHDYKASNLGLLNCLPKDLTLNKCSTTGNNSYTSFLFGSVYNNYNNIKNSDYTAINPPPSLDYKYWFTEYNLLDRSNNIHGSWAHALHTAEMALLYLKDADKVELINCHTLIGNGIWSSIFNSDDGYKYSQNVANSFCQPTSTDPQPATNPFTLTALGLVMNQLGLALKDATTINEVTFGSSVPPVTTLCNGTSTNPGLISWRTQDEAGNIQVLFLNLTNNNIDVQYCVNNVFPSGTNFNNVSYQTFGFSPNDYFVGYLPTSSTVDVFNNFTGINSSINVPINNLSSQTLNISPYSITRAWVYSSNVAIKANTNQFCEGTEFMLTAITNPNATNFQWYDLTSGTPVAITGATSKTFYKTAIGPSMVLRVEATLSGATISDDITITVSGRPNITIAGGPYQSFCAGSTISLTANASSGTGSTYYYNWTPSTNLNTGSSLDATLDYALTENTDFTVYVSDGTCSAKNTVRVNAIGNYDFSNIPDRICSNLTFNIDLADPNSTSATYLWSNGATTSTFSLPNPSGPNYAVTATFNYIGGSCIVNKSFVCNEVSCCSAPPLAISIGGNNYTNNNVDYLESEFRGAALADVVIYDVDNDGINIENSNASPAVILINNDFIVDKDLRLKRFNFILSEGARIIVKPYRTLNLVDCQLSSCNNYLWDGIVVEEHGKIRTNTTIPDLPLLPSPTEIKDARNAIQLKDYTEYTIQKTSFVDNLIGMKFIGNSIYPNRSFGQISNVDFKCSNSIGTIKFNYTGMTEFVPSNKAFSGIDIENGTLVLTDPSTTIANVRFSNLSCGINARNSVLSLNGFKFFDLYLHPDVNEQWSGTAVFNEGYPYINGSSAYTFINNTYLTSNSNSGFENLNQGIYQNRGTLRAVRSIMTNVKQGIFVRDLLTDFIEINLNQINTIGQGITAYRNDGASRININQNYINVNNPLAFPNSSRFGGWGVAALERGLRHYSRSIDVRCNGISLFNALNGMYVSSANNAVLVENSVLLNNDVNQSGLYLTATSKSILSNNAVEGVGFQFYLNNSKGVLLSMSPENDLYNNYTNNTGMGFDFWNINTQTNMIGNRMGTHNTGLHINRSGIIGPQFLGSSNNSNGNRWFGYTTGSGYSSGFGAINENNGDGLIDPDAPTYSQFFIDNTNSLGTLYYPDNLMPGFSSPISSGWFFLFPNLPPITLTVVQNCEFRPIENIERQYSIFDSLIVQDRVTANEFGEEVKYISARDLFEKLQKDSILLLENEFFSAYYDSIANYNMGTLGQVSYLLHDLYKVDQYTDSINTQLTNDLEAKIDRIKNINELFINGNLNSTDSLNLTTEGKYIVFEISKIKEQIGAVKKNLQISINSKAFAAMELNNSVTPNNLIETNEKYINNFLLQDIVSPRTPNNEELATLVSIAIQCPFSGGRSVYTARNILYEYVPDLTYTDMDLCTAEGLMRKRNNEKVSSESSILISPNPTSNFSKVVYLNENNPIIKIEILANDGKLLLQQNNSLPFFVNSLDNGLYVVKCTTNNGSILTAKLNIVK